MASTVGGVRYSRITVTVYDGLVEGRTGRSDVGVVKYGMRRVKVVVGDSCNHAVRW